MNFSKPFKFFLIAIFFVGIISPIFVFAAESWEPCKNSSKDSDPIKFYPQVNIPGTIFNASTDKEGKPIGIPIDCNSIGKMASDVYKFIAGIAGIAAVIVMMAGGYVWLFAGGNASKVGEAKSLIGSAVLGLFLVLGSYMILNLINPELIKLKSLDDIAGITKMTVDVKKISTLCSAGDEVGLSGEGCGKTMFLTSKNECMRTSCYIGSICRINADEQGYYAGGNCVKSLNILMERDDPTTSKPFSVGTKRDPFVGGTLSCGNYDTNPNIVYSECFFPDGVYTTCAYIQQTVESKPRSIFISGLNVGYWYKGPNKNSGSDKSISCYK